MDQNDVEGAVTNRGAFNPEVSSSLIRPPSEGKKDEKIRREQIVIQL